MLRQVNLKLAVPVTLLVVAALTIAKEIYKAPEPLLMFIGAMFLVCSAVFWSLNRRSKASAYVQISRWLLGWSFVTASLLWAAHRFDKAGWIWFKLTGYNVTLPEYLSERMNWPAAELAKRQPFFAIDPEDSTRLLIDSGEYDIDETIIVPPGLSLTMAPGAVLRFGAGCSLISYSPIIARGTENESIIFTAQNKWRKWGVVGVVRAGQSIFEHVRFEHGRQALINGIDFPGALSLIETETKVTQSHFVNLFGKDAAQVHGGQAFFRNNTFQDCFKDGLDFDGGAGEVSHNRFARCGDEAIDLGEDSRVQVFDNIIVGAKDARMRADSQLNKHRTNY